MRIIETYHFLIAWIFSRNANLGSLLDSTEPIQLSQAVHKAIIEVNEDGVEAAAATGKSIEILKGFLVQQKIRDDCNP